MEFIKKIKIRNFKCLEDIEIDLKSPTLLFGPNASGKSTFIKALIFLHENIQNIYNKTKFSFNNLDLISFKDIVFKGDLSKQISFELLIEGEFPFISKEFFEEINIVKYKKLLEEQYNQLDDQTKEYYNYDKLFSSFQNFLSNKTSLIYLFNELCDELLNSETGGPLNINADFLEQETIRLTLQIKFIYDEFGYCFDKLIIKDIDSKIELIYQAKRYKENLKKDIDIKLRNNHVDIILNHPSFQNKTNFITFPNLTDINTNYGDFNTLYLHTKLNYIFNYLFPNNILAELNYNHLTAIRRLPKAKYLLNNGDFSPKDYYGIPFFLTYPFKRSETEEILSLKRDVIKKQNLVEIDKINLKLKEIELNSTIFIEKKNEIGKILVNTDGVTNNLANESSGLTQILPIVCFLKYPYISQDFIDYDEIRRNIINAEIVYSNYVPPMLYCEQPELHLHPKLQANLALLFTNENAIIETHSEHLIKKIQVLVAKGKLSKDSIGVYYFDKVNGKTKVKKMEIQENGFFKESWPDGFFDDSANLSWELLGASRKN